MISSLSTFKMPEGTVLFRGAVQPESAAPANGWFTNSAVNASVYGDVSQWQLQRSSGDLLDMANPENIKTLQQAFIEYAEVHSVNPSLLTNAFAVTADNRVERDSEFIADTVIMNFIASTFPQFSGFGAVAMPYTGTTSKKLHHWEVCLQDPDMRLISKQPISPQRRNRMRMERLQQQQCKKRKIQCSSGTMKKQLFF